ncbi:MAG: winged helix-turn-helix domain-containing protein, partial [Jiangellaceae bacterium]
MGVAVRLFGGVRVEFDGSPVQVGGRLPRLIIASLVLADGRALSSERLIELVWGDDPPVTARRTLQSYVAGMRRTLGGAHALSAS